MQPFIQEDTFDVCRYFNGYRVRRYKDGDVVYDNHSAEDMIYIVRQGIVRVSMLSRQGFECLLFYGYPGCLLGDAMCFSLQTVSQGVLVVARGNCEVAQIKQSAFRAACAQHPELAMAVVRKAYVKFTSVLAQLEAAVFHDTVRQVASLVYAFSEQTRRKPDSRSEVSFLNITHQMLAAATGRTRVSITNALNRLQVEGAIRLRRCSIEVLDEKILLQYLDDVRERDSEMRLDQFRAMVPLRRVLVTDNADGAAASEGR